MDTAHRESIAWFPPGHSAVPAIFQYCPWPEVKFGAVSISRDTIQKSASAPGPPRCFKSHWWNKDHMNIEKLPTTSKVIVVYRDAESVFKSYVHHMLDKYFGYQVTREDFPNGNAFDTFFEMFMAGELEYGEYM